MNSEYKPRGKDRADLIAFHQERLAAYYAQFAPDKVALVGELIPRYAETDGGLDHMWKTLRTKYGSIPNDVLSGSLPTQTHAASTETAHADQPPTPSPASPLAVSSVAVNSDFVATDVPDPTRRDADPLVEKSEPRVRFKEEVSEAPDPTIAARVDPQLFELHRQRLRRYYQYYYLPRKLDKLDESLLSKCTTPEMLDKMWENLEATYGREKDIPTAIDEVWEMEKQKSAQRQRLEKYFQYYLPMRMEDLVEAMIDKSISRHDSFDEMWQYLEATYGSESSVEAQSSHPMQPPPATPIAKESMLTPSSTLRSEVAVQCRDFISEPMHMQTHSEESSPRRKTVSDASTSIELERSRFLTAVGSPNSVGSPGTASFPQPAPAEDRRWKWDSSWMPNGVEIGWNSLCAKSSPHSTWYQPAPNETMLMEPHPGSGVTTSPSVSLFAQTPAERLHFGLSPNSRSKSGRTYLQGPDGGSPQVASAPPAFHGSKLAVPEEVDRHRPKYRFDPTPDRDRSTSSSTVPSQALVRCQTISSPSRTPRPSVTPSNSLY